MLSSSSPTPKKSRPFLLKRKFQLSIAMSCLHCHSPFLPLNSQLNKQKLKPKQQLLLFSSEPAPNLVLLKQNVHMRTNATSTPLFIAAKIPPSQSGDIAVFLQTSALLLVVYFLANFVAPYFISKYFEFDKVGEDRKTNENDSQGR
ncbi:hypothetical protein V6N13_049608 [Hibiscus sabdariffa]|uniref:Uncharacterized protein n=1 Tax=Hibiscus sabdariffa TaxID=183260 RepID=A0ABR2QWP4_9ROSI